MIKRVCAALFIALALLAGGAAVTPDYFEYYGHTSPPNPAPSGTEWA